MSNTNRSTPGITKMEQAKERSSISRIGQAIRARRLELGLTQEAIAFEMGIRLQQYQRYEYGIASLENARMKTGLRLCALLGLDPYETVFGCKE